MSAPNEAINNYIGQVIQAAIDNNLTIVLWNIYLNLIWSFRML